MDWLDLSWLRFDRTITVPAVIALCALIAATISSFVAVRTYRRSRPNLKIEPILEAYDTRQFRSGQIAWYWTLRIINSGGRAFTLLGIQEDVKELPMIVLAKDAQLIDMVPDHALYVTDVPKYEDVRDGRDQLSNYIPKRFEEYRAVNLTVGPGEAKALRMAFLVSFKDTLIDAIPVQCCFELSNRRAPVFTQADKDGTNPKTERELVLCVPKTSSVLIA